MGMSATQARYLALVAQQSNLEYQGQQINQERSILSQQVSELYNSLLTMDVPTPPSTQDFTTVQYKGSNGATTYTFDASDVKPGKDGGYNVTLGYTDYGHSLSRNNGYAVTSQGYEEVTGRKFSYSDTVTSPTEEIVTARIVGAAEEGETPKEFYIIQNEPPATGAYFVADEDYNDNGNFALVEGGKGLTENEGSADCKYYVYCNDSSKWDPDTCVALKEKKDIKIDYNKDGEVSISQKDLDSLYVVDSNNNLRKAEAGRDYKIAANGSINLMPGTDYFLAGQGTDKANKGSDNGYKIGGYAAMTMAEYKATFGEKDMDTYNGYLEAFKNSGLVDSDGNPVTEEDFMVYIDNDGQPHFALASDVKDNDTCVTYDYIANGEFTKKEEYENAKLKFDPSSGRITSVEIPVKDASGEIVSWTNIPLEAATVTDENAYKDAYAKYEYAQYEYDRKQQEINAKTEKIQAMDRNLELRLQRLDTQRTQITTEIEALEKVLNDNIEKSYKTFSG